MLLLWMAVAAFEVVRFGEDSGRIAVLGEVSWEWKVVLLDAVGCLSVIVMGFLLTNAGFVASVCLGGVESRSEDVLVILDMTEVK